MLLETGKKSEYYQEILNLLKYRLENSDLTDNKWCFMIGDSSGRDFYTARPIEYMAEDEINKIKDEVLNDLEAEYDETDFYSMFEDLENNDDAEEELVGAGYGWSNGEFMDALREYFDNELFDAAFNSLIDENRK